MLDGISAPKQAQKSPRLPHSLRGLPILRLPLLESWASAVLGVRSSSEAEGPGSESLIWTLPASDGDEQKSFRVDDKITAPGLHLLKLFENRKILRDQAAKVSKPQFCAGEVQQ